ncbi:MAG: hypothetical protein KBF93_24540 [Leptospiraceae bacterium]|nr:hypothetical protein [Leptospiraceae bacterium]
MEFDDIFKSLLLNNKDNPDNILKLEQPIPLKYESNMNEFLEKFFMGDPFDIKPQDLELVQMGNSKVKKLKFDRRPSTYLSLLRFFELYRQLFKSMSSDLNELASCYKKFLTNETTDPKITELKKQILAEVFSAGRVLKNWSPQLEQFYKKTIHTINNSFNEPEDSSESNKKGFINLRKVYSESYLNLTFKPYYENMVNFCIVCIAYSSKLKRITLEYSSQTKTILGE